MEGQGAPNGGGGGGGGMGGGVPGGGIAAPSSKSPSRSTGGNGPSITFDGNVVVVNGGGPSTFVQQQQGGGGGGGSTTPVPTANGNSEVEEENNKPEQWQLDLLMEKLRQKSSMLKPLVDTSKNIRQALMERRCILDQSDKQSLQKSLDALQQSIKVNSLQSMVERLDMVARQLGLKFTPGATGHEWFISSDMFYLELIIDPNGVVEDVKIQHDGKTEQQSCPDIVESLTRTDFVDFTEHLEGLVSIYQLNADKKIKSKAFIALQALESDLALMSSTYAHIADAESVVMKSLLGLLQPRKGGHPVKLVYYVSPYEFLDVNTKTSLTNDVKTVLSKKLGSIATVSIQASTSHKLQMSTTVNIMRTPDGKSIPRYGNLNATNSTALPACFMVNMGKPIPMCVELLKAIQANTGIECFDFTNSQPILNLVTSHVSNGSLDCSNNKGLFVNLPDQVHCYFMTESPHLEGIMVSTISFTLASQLPQVISVLRQQVAFNTLLGSCIRVGSKPVLDHIVFEVSALSHQNLSVSFQHPLEDSLVTLEFDLRDVTHPQIRLHAVANATDIIPTLEEHACKVVKRSMSIPITLRAVIRRWQSMKVKSEPPNPDFSVATGSSNLGLDFQQLKDRSCGAESNERRNNSVNQNVVIPPGIMNFTNTNNGGLPASKLNTTMGSSSSSYSISPVPGYPQPPQSPMDILNSYMNPFLNFGNQLGSQGFPNVAMQILAASQMAAGQSNAPGLPLGLHDQVAQKRRKRKNTTENNIPSQQPINSQQVQQSLNNRPSQSPSRSNSVNLKSPIQSRRQSDSSEGSVGTMNEKNMFNLLMSEFMDQLPDSRWNIDITPVASSADTVDDVESLKRQGSKKTTPKRSMSLDSHSSEDIASIQNLIDGGVSGQDFKPLMTPSLSITPVSQTTTSNVNSLLASIRPGIEIIPLNQPVSIPSSITVTPIIGKTVGSNAGTSLEKSENKMKKKDRNITGTGSGTKRRLDEAGGESKPPKIPFLDSKGRMSPSVNMTKKPNSPSLNSPNSKPMASGGKPSVSTLKSVSSSSSNSGSPKYNTESKQKIKKPNIKSIKNLSNMTIPQLKAISPDLTSMPINKPDSSSSPNKPTGEINKTDQAKLINQNQLATAAVSTAIQQACASLVASQKPPIAKKGGLAAVIDKLKSVHSSSEPTTPESGKKESQTMMSNTDYLKVSSAITNDVLQQKKALGGVTPGAAGAPGPGPVGNPEYMIKGGQGLKLTINKTKLKDPTKSPKVGIPGLKSPSGLKKIVPGMKPLSALSAKLKSVTQKSSSALSNKDGKDSQVKNSGNNQQKKDGNNKRLESEDLTKKLFLPGAVKSLEMGAFSSAPVFDPNRFQIPKKSKSTPSGLSSSGVSSSKATSDTSSQSKPKKEASSTGSEVREKTTPSTTPTPMEIEPPELTAETSSTTSSSSLSHRSEPPPLIEVGSSSNPIMPLASAINKPIPVSGMLAAPVVPSFDTGPSEPDSTTTVSQDNKELSKKDEPKLDETEMTATNYSTGARNPVPSLSAGDFASPESPDPLNFVMNASTPQNIPTTPINPTPPSDDSPKVTTQTTTSAINLSTQSISSIGSSLSNPMASTIAAPSPIPNTVDKAPKPVQPTPPPVPQEDIDEDQLVIDDGSNANGSGNKDSTDVKAPGDKPIEETPETPVISSNNGNSSGNSSKQEDKTKEPEMPPPPAPAVELTNIAQVQSPAPVSLFPPSPKPIASPLGGAGTTVSIASVHIVHSPQPNSPALLRSPLVQASPAASPYAIDDDLMDEALIGGTSK